MNGVLYIDGKDAFVKYGITILEGSYSQLVEYPALKEVKYNNWHEEDGIEADLTSPVLGGRTLSLNFYSSSEAGRAALLALLTQEVYHDFDFRELGRTYRLRMVSEGGLTVTQGMTLFSLYMADDFPLDGYSYLAPLSSIVPTQGYSLDNRDLSEYGAYVLKGTLPEILKAPTIKAGLALDIPSLSGVNYDGQDMVRYSSKEVSIYLLMRAGTLAELWRNYNALLYDLVRPGECELVVQSTGKSYPCYYQSAAVSKFFPDGKIWLEFSIKLIFTNYRP